MTRSIKALFLGVLAVLVTACTPAQEPTLHLVSEPQARPSAAAPAEHVLPRSEPEHVRIPATGADSSLVPLGLNEDGTVEVPSVRTPEQAGWYSQGPTPGEKGPAVLLGHVDGLQHAGVFYKIDELNPGDEILVDREDGRTARFEVTRLQQVSKAKFPTREVYGPTGRAELRLVTCGGSFDHEKMSYRDSVIVYAKLA